MTKINVIKEEIQNNAKVWTNPVLMLKTSSEGPYLFQLKWFNEHMRVIKLYGHKVYCKLKVYESRYKHRAKISTKKLFISNFSSII